MGARREMAQKGDLEFSGLHGNFLKMAAIGK